MERSIDGISVKEWCGGGSKENPQRARCIVCPPTVAEPLGITFSIAEGFTGLKAHTRGTRHREHMEKKEAGEELDEPRQISMLAALDNQKHLTEKSRKEGEQLLKSQILFSNFVHSHGLPSVTFTCFAELAPKLFPDSKIARQWGGHGRDGMRMTKGNYFLTEGIAPFLKSELIEILRNSFFSVNVDESSVNKKTELDVHVSFWKDNQIQKQNLTTVSMLEGTSAQELCDAIVKVFEDRLIPLAHIVSLSTDGCSVMLGDEGGLHALLRQRIPHLPRWGGCSCHDCSNILKAATPKLCPQLTNLYSQLHTYLSSASLHRKRGYEAFCKERGLETHSIPKFFDVRFRTITACAEWMELDDRCLYLWFRRLAEDVKAGRHEDITAAEEFIMENYLSNYIYIRLCNQFIIEVSKPILTVINHFESEEPVVFSRFEVLVDFLTTLFSKFLINGGMDKDNVKTKDLLELNVREKKLQLGPKDVYLGSKAEQFITKLGFTRTSPELIPWLEQVSFIIFLCFKNKILLLFKIILLTLIILFIQVQAFYITAAERAQKYFKPPLTSRLLQYCDVLEPKTFFATKVDTLKKQFKYMAEKFPNVNKATEVPDLMDQVASLRSCDKLKECVTVMSPTEFFGRLQSWQDGKYELVSRLGKAILTNHGSGSFSERDFSLMNWLLADPCTNRTSQERLEARLGLKSHVINLKHDCEKCIQFKEKKAADEELKNLVTDDSSDQDENDDDENKNSKKKAPQMSHHCHCPQFKVSEKMLAYMSDGQPSKRNKALAKKKREAAKVEDRISKSRLEEDRKEAKDDLKTEVHRLRRALKSKEKEKKESEARAKKTPVVVPDKKVERLEKRKKLQAERAAKKQKLFLLF